jgi:hypothetical protein
MAMTGRRHRAAPPPHPPGAGAGDADRDLPAVGDQHGAGHASRASSSLRTFPVAVIGNAATMRTSGTL